MPFRRLTLAAASTLWLGACQAYPPHASTAPAIAPAAASITLLATVTPGYRLASAVRPFTVDDVASVTLAVYPLGSPDDRRTLEVPYAQLHQPVTISNLAGDTTYVVEATAISRLGRVISDAARSRLTLAVQRETVLAPQPVPVQLIDRAPQLRAVGVPTVIASGAGARFAPALAFSGDLNTAVVTWKEATSGYAAQRLSAGGTLISGRLTMAANSHADPPGPDGRRPSVIVNGINGKFVVATTLQAGGTTAPLLTAFGATGGSSALIEVATERSQTASSALGGHVRPALAHIAHVDTYMWAEPGLTSGVSLTAQPNGGAATAFTLMAGDDHQARHVAMAPLTRLGATIVAAVTPAGLLVQAADHTGGRGAVSTLSAPGAAVGTASLCAIENPRSAEFLVAWHEAGRGYVAHRVRHDGVPVGEAFTVGAATASGTVSLAYSAAADEYAVVYDQDGAVKWQRLSGDGARLGEPFTLGAGFDPAVAYNSRQNAFVLTWCRRVADRDEIVAQAFDSYVTE